MSNSVVFESAVHDTHQCREAAFKDLVAWVTERHAEDHCPAQVFNVMRASGWSCDDAVAALLQALPYELHEQVRVLPRGAPDLDLSNRPSTITIDGHTVQVLCDMRHPRLIVFGNLLSADECNELIAGASPRLKRSMIKDDDDELQFDDRRSSSDMLFQRDETPLCTRLDARIAALLNWPVSHMERMQVLRYGKDQQCTPHYDDFESKDGMWSRVFRRGGQRVGSMVIYLNTPPLGGSTVFPDIPMEVRAVAGNAVFFAYETRDPTSRILHGGAPVGEGEKWVALKWFRQGPLV
jgi:prolyl 4-hydroxylase